MEWVENNEAGNKDRLFKTTTYKDIKLFQSPNNIIVIQKCENTEFLCKEGDIVKNNRVFMLIDKVEYSFEFKFKMIEIGRACEYSCIILILDEINDRNKRRGRKHRK